MSISDVFQLILFIGLLIALAPPLGSIIATVFMSQPRASERRILGLIGVDPQKEMTWAGYAAALLLFNMIGFIVTLAIQLLQNHLPLNPQQLPGLSWDLAMNTAVSFVTNTNWQAYAGEATMSPLTQALALTTQNFLSAATGLAVAVALARGIARKQTKTIGNFWIDVTRATFILLPLSVALALSLSQQGVPQTIQGQEQTKTVEGVPQTIPVGPVASQVAIKQIGTNGGGYYNANSAHPFENPTPLTNFLEMFAILLVPAALVFAFGRITGARSHAKVIFGVMLVLFLLILAGAVASESMANPVAGAGSWLEGKETRFGLFGSVLFAITTTAASCGAINALHSSLSPLAGGLAMFNMHLGEVVFGGVGAGLYGMMLFVLLTVFLAGLMVGRSPEYLGKKIEAREMTMVVIAILAPSAMILLGTGLSVILPAGLKGLSNTGPHGFSEIFYAFTSAAANNGSAFAGLSANTPYYNVFLAVAMLVGRFAIILPILRIAGLFAEKKTAPLSAGTFEVDTILFGVLLAGVIVIVGGLTFIPGLALGPIVEHFLMIGGKAL